MGFFLAVGAVLLPLAGVQWAARQAEGAVKAQVLDAQVAAIEGVLGRVEVAYDAAVSTALGAAERPGLNRAVVDHDGSGTAAVLENVMALGFFRSVHVFDATGDLLAANPPESSTPDPGHLRREPLISRPIVVDGMPLVEVRAPFLAEGRVTGLLVAAIPFRQLVGGPEGLRLSSTFSVTIVDKSSTILASVLPDGDGLKVLAPEAVGLITGGRVASSTYFAPRFGYEVLSTFVPTGERAWGALAVSPRTEVLADASALADRLRAGAVALVLVSLAMVGLVARHIGRAERDLRLAHLELDTQNRALGEANADLASFADVAAHDLRSPLTTIGGFASLALQIDADRLSEPGRAALERVGAGVERMAALIDAVLDYARAGSAQVRAERVDLTSLAHEVVDRVRPIIDERSGQVEVHALPDVSGDPVLLAQVLQNLIVNGINYGATTSPVVVVDGAATTDGVRIRVRDNGSGVPHAERESVFGMFVRGSAGASCQGTGIGLAMCRRIAERHGGTLSVGDAPGGGAVFELLLPTQS